ncbi:MAG: Blue-light-activated protein [Syntrophus sp. PtaU1.Bin208]|nr:MAG: Blue-light-activated protein [Syntrophus sp. PtaU1.Bin208]
MRKKILIIDDNNHLSLFLEKKLTDAGHEVVTTTNALSAFKILEDYTPDIILCDYFLPNINGDELCQRIRQMDSLKNVYLTIMSAAAHELDLDPSSIGADTLIAKGSFKETEALVFAVLKDAEKHGHGHPELGRIGLEYTTARQLTKELIAKNRYLQTMLDSIAEGIIEVCSGQIVYVNAPAMKILGKPQDQLLLIALPTLFDGPARTQIEALLGSEAQDSILIEQPETEQRDERILSVKRLPSCGESSNILILIEDVTRRIQAEKTLRDSHHHMEALVQERTEDLKRANEMLKQVQKLEAIGTLAGGIAHDFNNILSSMIGYMELAKLTPSPDKRQFYLDRALQVSNRAKDMIKQILIFSRPQEQEKKPVLLAPLIKEGIKMLRATLPSTIQINQRIPDQSIMILADSTQIHQILMNLATNAFHAMREKGGILDIELDQEKIEPGKRPLAFNLTTGEYARLTVRDTGHGIDSAIVDRIFDPFFTTKGPGEGTGLGLSVVYGIVRDHGGRIHVVSEPGQGTVINVYLPLIETVEPTKSEDMEPIPKGSEHVLFVDDEAAILDVTKAMLTTLGFKVTARQSSTDALELFRSQPHSFDIVVTDMTMPHMRGDELAAEMLKIRSDIPIILCTGYSDLISEEKAREIGIRQFLMKPLSLGDLARAVRKVLV